MDKRLEFGPTFSRVFDLYGKHAVPLLTWAAIVQLILSLLIALLVTGIMSGAGLGAALVAGAVLVGIGIIASTVLTGAYIVGVSEVEATGTFPAFGEVLPRVTPRIGALIITSIIAAIGIGFGFLLLFVPGLILMTWWAIIAPVVMLEDKSGPDALGRSRELVRGNGWTVFGLIVVTFLLTGLASNIIGGIVGAILGGQDSFLGSFGGNFVGGTLVAPIGALLLAVVIYQNLTGTSGSDEAPAPPATEPTTPPAEPPSSGPFV